MTVIVALTLLASAYSGHIDPRRWFLYPFLAIALPGVLAVALLTAVAWAIARKWWLAALPIIATAFSWPSVRTVTPFHPFAPNVNAMERDSTTFKLITFNVSDFGPYNQKNFMPNPSMRYLLDQEADVVLLQEGSQERDYLKLSQNLSMIDELNAKYPYHSAPRRDLLILSRYPYDEVTGELNKRLANYSIKKGGHIRVYDVHLPSGDVRFINVHLFSIGLDSKDKDEFVGMTNKGGVTRRSEMKHFKRGPLNKVYNAIIYRDREVGILREVVAESPTERVVVAGDFNDTPASWCYWKARGDDLNDAWADAGFGYVNTFNKHRMWFKIDQMLYRGVNVEAIQRDRVGDSDHYPLCAVFRFK